MEQDLTKSNRDDVLGLLAQRDQLDARIRDEDARNIREREEFVGKSKGARPGSVRK
jgi:hypothetical protein